ncbi:hypothetical protein T265_10573 [Opisthorchis viverrini]|uniref:Uncharacterized protein n=1 Tax=Opisthorchis viverrini TaxID=6198 RepID=A0A074ZCS3_OPIVI|nr:hypothetical protein T265_10573 [Opisthorchis viverrini]KER20995.1 hypothetical protein T265_10573 [Opisthorchis viverrini]
MMRCLDAHQACTECSSPDQPESVPVKNGGKGGNAKLMSLQKNKVLCLEDDIRVGKSETPPVQLNEGGVTTDVDSSSLVEHKD